MTALTHNPVSTIIQFDDAVWKVRAVNSSDASFTECVLESVHNKKKDGQPYVITATVPNKVMSRYRTV